MKMMIDQPPIQIGVRELRDRLTTVVEQVKQGLPHLVLTNNVPIAAMLSYKEAVWWERVELGLASLHGLEIYPEVARDTSELARIIRGQRRVSQRELQTLARHPREVLTSLDTVVGISEGRLRMAEILAQVDRGKSTTMLSGGQFAVVLISSREYRRLLRLRRVVIWFAAAGLDLAESESDDVVNWVRARRAAPMAADADEGSAIA